MTAPQGPTIPNLGIFLIKPAVKVVDGLERLLP